MLVPEQTKHRYVPVGQPLQSAVESHTGRAREEVAPEEREVRETERRTLHSSESYRHEPPVKICVRYGLRGWLAARRRTSQAELPQHGPGDPLYRVERRRPPGIEEVSQPPAIVGAEENIAIRPHDPCHLGQRLSGSRHPRKDAQGQHYLERGIRKGEAVHVLNGAVHLLSDTSLCRSLARAPDHVIHRIDGVDDETALSQCHGCEPRSAPDIEYALAGRERQFLNPSERNRQAVLKDRWYEA